MEIDESKRGTSVGWYEAYNEGYCAKYLEWINRENPYLAGTDEHEGFACGYFDAVAFAC